MRSGWPTPDRIIPLIEQILESQPAGLSEYELLNLLAAQEPFFAESGANQHPSEIKPKSQSLNLFQRHFLLFHCLYRLEQQFRTSRSGLLTISALEIKVLPYQLDRLDETRSIATPDPVREYYLDITHLQSTDEDEVDEMLGKFWLALSRHEVRGDALALLGLSDPVDDTTIRKRYREQVMQHHPDRGGDLETIQQLNAAVSNLLPKSG